MNVLIPFFYDVEVNLIPLCDLWQERMHMDCENLDITFLMKLAEMAPTIDGITFDVCSI